MEVEQSGASKLRGTDARCAIENVGTEAKI